MFLEKVNWHLRIKRADVTFFRIFSMPNLIVLLIFLRIAEPNGAKSGSIGFYSIWMTQAKQIGLFKRSVVTSRFSLW